MPDMQLQVGTVHAVLKEAAYVEVHCRSNCAVVGHHVQTEEQKSLLVMGGSG